MTANYDEDRPALMAALGLDATAPTDEALDRIRHIVGLARGSMDVMASADEMAANVYEGVRLVQRLRSSSVLAREQAIAELVAWAQHAGGAHAAESSEDEPLRE